MLRVNKIVHQVYSVLLHALMVTANIAYKAIRLLSEREGHEHFPVVILFKEFCLITQWV